VTRPRAHVPARGNDRALWEQLGTIGSRLAVDRLPGFAVSVRNEFLRLSSTAVPSAERIELLASFCVDQGASPHAVRAAIDRTRDRTARLGRSHDRDAAARSAARRERLTDPDYRRNELRT
jgi:hypothetical protein